MTAPDFRRDRLRHDRERRRVRVATTTRSWASSSSSTGSRSAPRTRPRRTRSSGTASASSNGAAHACPPAPATRPGNTADVGRRPRHRVQHRLAAVAGPRRLVRLRRGRRATPRQTRPGTATTARSTGPPGRSARFGQALSFDGVNDRVPIPDANTLDLTTGMTLEAWVKPAALGTAWKTVLFKHRSEQRHEHGLRHVRQPEHERAERRDHDRDEREGRERPTGRGSRSTSGRHLAATFDDATLRLFVNGNQVASLATAGADRHLHRRPLDRRQQRLERVVQRRRSTRCASTTARYRPPTSSWT